MNKGLEGKHRLIREILRSYPSVLVAYSGGVDSTLLAVLAHRELGDRMSAIIVTSPLMPPREFRRAERLAGSLGLPLQVIEIDELSLPGFKNNPPDRCYICKKHRLTLIGERARAGGWDTVMDGSNADDASMHRPGRKATEEMGGVSPLEEAGFSKSDIRSLARDIGLPNWDAPSRPCLATRFRYGMELKPRLLRRVDEAEMELERMGFREIRVRLESPDEARIEVGKEELETVAEEDNRSRLVKKFRDIGFRRILLDLEGYRSGSMEDTDNKKRLEALHIAEG